MTTPITRRPGHAAADGAGNLTATAVSGGEIDLSWPAATDNVGVTGYQLERCPGGGCSLRADRARRPGPATRTRPSAGTSYSYRVRATDAAGNLGRYTTTASATTPAADTQPPTGPASLSAIRVGRRDRPLAGRRRPTTWV